MRRYFKYRWEESRGDKFDDWGFSTFYLEIDEKRYSLRQIEVYDNGNILKYDENHSEDEFGFLAEKTVDEELRESGILEITNVEFEEKWLNLKALNRK